MPSAWAFVAALTICSAYFGRLGVLEEYGHVIQQADEILRFFARNSPQAKHYSLILKTLSKATLDYVKHLEHSEQAAQNTLMPELFRLNHTLSTYDSDGSRASADLFQSSRDHIKLGSLSTGSYSYISQRQASKGALPTTSSGTVRAMISNPMSNQASVSITGDSESLIDLATSFYSLNNTQLDMYSDLPGGSASEDGCDLENTESLWDLNWAGTIL